MSKTTKIIVACSAAAFAVIAVVVLLCVFLIKEDELYAIDGSGTVTVSEDENGNTVLYAKPDQWQSFAGWYYEDESGSLVQLSTSSSITVTSDTPNNLTAVFKASTLDALDRVLNGVYNKYSSAVASEEDYLNFSTDIDLNYTFGDTTGEYNLKVGGYINFNGAGSQFYVVVNSEESANTIFALYYVDNVDDAYLYIDVEGEQSSYPFISISGLLGNLPTPSSTTWSIESILTSAGLEDIYSMLESWFGLENAANFCGDAVNSENSTTFSLNLHSVLTTLKTMLSVLTNSVGETAGAIIEEVMDVLTGNYTGANILPELVLEFTVGYNTVDGVECVDSIGLNLSISDEYVLNIGEGFTIPETNLSITLNDIVFEFSQTANGISDEVLAVFPEVTQYLLNFHVGGQLTFLTETTAEEVLSAESVDESETTNNIEITDVYDVDLYADLNIGALSGAISSSGFDYTKIDWDNLGFLSFTITLNEDSPTDNHTNSDGTIITDYLNIFIDTDKYGPVLYVYVGLYNPEILAANLMNYLDYYLAQDYFINTSFYLPELVAVLAGEYDEEETVSATTLSSTSSQVSALSTDTSSILNLVVSILESVISGDVNFNQLLVEVLSEVFTMVDNSSIDTYLSDISYDEEYGIVIGTSALRETVDGLLDLTELNLGTYTGMVEVYDFSLANAIFGKETTHIALSFDEFSYGTVVRGASNGDGTLGDYYGEDKEYSLIELYNQKHPTLIGVDDLSVSGGSSFTSTVFDSISDLLGTSVIAGTGTFSDGSTSGSISNLVGEKVNITLAVIGVEVIEDYDTYATVKLVLRKNITDNFSTIAAFMSSVLPESIKDAKSIDDILYIMGIPGGIYVYETTVYLSATPLTANIDFDIDSNNNDLYFNVTTTMSGATNSHSFTSFNYQNSTLTGVLSQSEADVLATYKDANITLAPNSSITFTLRIANYSDEDMTISLNKGDDLSENVSLSIISYNYSTGTTSDYTIGSEITFDSGYVTFTITVSLEDYTQLDSVLDLVLSIA